MLQLERNVLSVALASAMLLGATNARAQSTGTTGQDATQSDAAQQPAQTADDAKTLDRVEVTGIRRGIEDAIETKQSSTSIVEAVSAEDIGKLPDTSIADSLARLPGLTAQRFGGRPQEINIRGFAGDFSTTLLNGTEQVSLGNNRGVEFDQYPSELMNQVVVYKTPDASLVGQGLSGTVDLQTVRPLSFGERAVAANARYDLNKIDHGDDQSGGRYSISYIDQFADRTVGIALGYAHLNNPQQQHQFEAWGYDGTTGILGGGKLYDIQDDNTRDGFMATLEFKPSDDFHSVLDVFYSKFDKDQNKRGMEFGLNGPVGTPDDFTVSGFDPVLRNDFNSQHDTLFALGWKNELRLGDAWTLRTDLSTSSGKRDERILETYAGLVDGLTDSAHVTANDGFFDFDFGLDYADPDILRLTDAGGWGQDGYIKDFRVKDKLSAVRVDLERTFESGMFSSLEFGANLTDRIKSRSSNEAFLCLQACKDGAAFPMPADLARDPAFGFATLDALYGYDALAAYNTIYNSFSNNHPDIANKNWEVDERVGTAYVQFNINTDLGPVPVKGNVGIQAVNVDQSSSGFETYPANVVGQPIDGSAHYTDYLPSMNLSFSLPADQRIRFGAARQMARPRMDQMRANDNVDVNRSLSNNPITGEPNPDDPNNPGQKIPWWTKVGGNPTLKPWLANAYDLSYEKYFDGNKGYVSVAYFYKDLRTYIYDEVGLFNINDTTLAPADYPFNPPPNPEGTYTRPVNGQGGVLKGYELAVSVPLDLLWQPLEGFGISANYSDTTSDIQPLGPDHPGEPLPGLSKYISNITAYYERYGFSTRVSQRKRSAFLGEVQGFGGDRTKTNFDGETVIDFQMGYTFQSGPLEDLSILLQVNNINNEPFRSSFAENQPKQYFEYGRTYLLGLNYRF
ncbi:MAG TPA: TonB-dependent receptor [Luteimonas sp.]|nr:TonB-dependent receptor [Luteimonas sp.]